MNLNLYRKKAALDRALNGKAVSGQKFEVFAIHSRGYFTREPLCDSTIFTRHFWTLAFARTSKV